MSLPGRNDLTDISEINELKHRNQDDSVNPVSNERGAFNISTKRISQMKSEGYLSKNQIDSLYKIIFEPYKKSHTDNLGKKFESDKQQFSHNGQKL